MVQTKMRVGLLLRDGEVVNVNFPASLALRHQAAETEQQTAGGN